MKKLIDEMLAAKKEFVAKCQAVEDGGIAICGLPSGTHLHLENSDTSLWWLARKLGTKAIEGEPNGEMQRFQFTYAGEEFYWLA